MNIKKRAEEYKKQNGNSNLTQKDLLFYIVGRLDDIEKKMQIDRVEVAKVKAELKALCFIFPSAIAILLYILN